MSTPTAIAASQLIKDALVKINVISETDTPSAEQQATCIRVLNEMMAMWAADGLQLNYIPVGAVTSVLTVPDGAIMGIKCSLAIAVCSEFGATASPELIAAATQGMSVVSKICARKPNFQMDTPCPADWQWGCLP